MHLMSESGMGRGQPVYRLNRRAQTTNTICSRPHPKSPALQEDLSATAVEDSGVERQTQQTQMTRSIMAMGMVSMTTLQPVQVTMFTLSVIPLLVLQTITSIQ